MREAWVNARHACVRAHGGDLMRAVPRFLAPWKQRPDPPPRPRSGEAHLPFLLGRGSGDERSGFDKDKQALPFDPALSGILSERTKRALFHARRARGRARFPLVSGPPAVSIKEPLQSMS